MSRMTAADQRRITRDWARAFPALGVWKPLRLLRRAGPVLQGIVLERSSAGDDYLPTAHVHALVRPFPTIAMALAEPLRSPRGVQDRIRLGGHDERWEEAAGRLRVQSPLALDRPFTLDELVEAYRRWILDRQQPGVPSAVDEIEDHVLVAAAVGRVDQVDAGLALARSLSAEWSAEALARWDRDEGWLEELAARAADPAGLAATVEAEAARHGLEKLPELPLD